MDLRAVLLRATAARPRVLLLTMPGATAVRLAAERELRRRDLPEARTPAEANVLFVAGAVGPSLEPAVDRLWRDMPAPRVRAHARTADEVAAAVAASRVSLATPLPRPGIEGHGEGTHHHGGGHGDGTGMPAGPAMAERGPDRDGLALDRVHLSFGPFLPDWPAGLTMRLTLQGDVIQRADLAESLWGATAAVSPYWTEPWTRAAAGEEVLLGEAARRRAAAHLDSLGRFLAVAGWPGQATAARRLRDDLVAGAEAAAVRPRAERFARRTGRSRTLYWLTRGMGELSRAEAEAAGVSGPAARADGDVPARYREWLTAVVDDVARLDDRTRLNDRRPLGDRRRLYDHSRPNDQDRRDDRDRRNDRNRRADQDRPDDHSRPSDQRRPDDRSPHDPAAPHGPRGRLDGPRPPSAALAAVLPRLLAGAEVAAARLIVASLDPDPDELAAQLPAAARG